MIIFINQWRFRANWRGKLILQRRLAWHEQRRLARHDDGMDFSRWQDATTEDLGDYFAALSGLCK